MGAVNKPVLLRDMKQLLLISAVLIASTHAFPTVVTNTTCFHSVDSEDHKCFEACADENFATKGITDAGTCPSSFATVDKTATVYQCPDGVTNVRYCASTALNVTIATKGEAGIEALAAVFQESAAQDFSVYC